MRRRGAIFAPWTAEQVDALNRFQHASIVHPFTCPGHEGGGDRELVATRRGWICPHCGYTQNWAHRFMCDPPLDPLEAGAPDFGNGENGNDSR